MTAKVARVPLEIDLGQMTINDEPATPWEWEIEFCAMARRHCERMENEKLSFSELYEEAREACIEMSVYWAGLDEVAQRRCARDFKDLLVGFMDVKDRMRAFAEKELARSGVLMNGN